MGKDKMQLIVSKKKSDLKYSYSCYQNIYKICHKEIPRLDTDKRKVLT